MSDNTLLSAEIKKLQKERNAIILAHNYQCPEVQDLADVIGDSLELARQAQKTDADVIVFCGVDFMAETASILNPGKTVLMPAKEAQCPLAAMLPPDVIQVAKEKYPDAKVVMYVNTTAAAKTYADIICTSGNAVKVVESMESDEILFAPDKNLAYYVQQRTKKKIIPIPNYGMCIVHDNIKPEYVKTIKKKYPNAKLTVHPECLPEVQEIADHIGSTKGMMEYVKNDPSKEFIIGTEEGIIHRMKKEAPGKIFHPINPLPTCRNMKKTNIQNLYEALLDMKHEVKVPSKIADKARKPIERMLNL
ncbi:MAG: quinolinate synthase NadA [Candidatus Altiarchaeota archaeon]|nr:quinolinate synthase NadA [Candidatus Altiarchaeota archaeon]